MWRGQRPRCLMPARKLFEGSPVWPKLRRDRHQLGPNHVSFASYPAFSGDESREQAGINGFLPKARNRHVSPCAARPWYMGFGR